MKTLLHRALIASIALLLCTTLNAQNTKTKAPSSRINFEYFESLIYIKVKVQNKPNLVFLVNTGANTSVIHTKTAQALKLKMLDESVVIGNAGNEKVHIAKVGRLQIGNKVLNDVSLTSRNLSAWSSPNGKTIDGIIGTDILSNYIVTIDYKNKHIHFGRKTDKPKKKFEYNVPFTLDEGMVKMDATLDDSFQTQVSFNSGASLENTGRVYVNISPATWRKMQQTEKYAAPVQYLSGNAVGGTVRLPVVPIKKMEFEKFKIQLPYVVIQSKEGYYKNEDAVGFFGNNLLEKCEVVCLNFKDNTISFNNPKPIIAKTPSKRPVVAQTSVKAPARIKAPGAVKAPIKTPSTKTAKD